MGWRRGDILESIIRMILTPNAYDRPPNPPGNRAPPVSPLGPDHPSHDAIRAEEPAIKVSIVVPPGPYSLSVNGDDPVNNHALTSRRTKNNHIPTVNFFPLVRHHLE